MFETDRLRVRPYCDDDFEEFKALNSDPEVMKYYPVYVLELNPKDLFFRNKERFEEDGHGFYVVEDKTTGEYLGQVGLLNQEIEGKIELEVAYQFKRSSWGKGYATEAAKACRDFAFEKFKLPHLISIINPENEASMSVAKRIGMSLDKKVEKWGRTVNIFLIKRNSWNPILKT